MWLKQKLKFMKYIFAILFMTSFLFTACKSENEKRKDKLEKKLDKAGDKLEEGAEEVEGEATKIKKDLEE